VPPREEWLIDYKQLKGELGLDHYEGRSYLGWYHHTALVTAAHGFLTLERLEPAVCWARTRLRSSD
jgi:SRSO17 transposase